MKKHIRLINEAVDDVPRLAEDPTPCNCEESDKCWIDFASGCGQNDSCTVELHVRTPFGGIRWMGCHIRYSLVLPSF
jgi:hypothetical protein